jgi:hypothetical protein
VRVFRRDGTMEREIWTALMEVHSLARHHLRASLSNDSELAIIEPRDVFGDPALLFFRKGKLVREGKTFSGGWETGTYFFEDATANRGATMEEFAHEKALRYEVQLFRTRAGLFSKEEKWVVPLRIPPPGLFQELSGTRKFGEWKFGSWLSAGRVKRHMPGTNR